MYHFITLAILNIMYTLGTKKRHPIGKRLEILKRTLS